MENDINIFNAQIFCEFKIFMNFITIFAILEYLSSLSTFMFPKI
jgi:hypothetical protein